MSNINVIYEALIKMSADEIKIFLNELGEVIDETKWKLYSSEPVDYNAKYDDDNINLATAGAASPEKESDQDGVGKSGTEYMVRYSYYPNSTGANSRDFCKLMVNANRVYRKEDILKMGSKPVNKGWGPKGASTYSIWLYKGGGSCHHQWYRQVYTNDLDKKVSDSKARSDGFKPETNNKNVSKKPKDMPNCGFLPSNPRGC